MESAEEELRRLRVELKEKDAELALLRSQLARCACARYAQSPQPSARAHSDGDCSSQASRFRRVSPLTNEQVARYSRHLLIPAIGVRGQQGILAAKVLVVGAGGLGCPVALYLAAAGIGRIGIADYDTVETSNLQRQIGHTERRVGRSKAESLAQSVKELNSGVECVVHNTLIDSGNALELFSQYDIIVDCSDNPATRYLVNDACVLANRPLISGSAVRMEGQLAVYHYKGGPCYRCIFPSPPPQDAVANCGDAGVLGAITGVIGSMQALEAVKIAAARGGGADAIDASYSQRMLLFDGGEGTFRSVKLRPRRTDCAVCGDAPTITSLSSYDYAQRCGPPTDKTAPVQLLGEGERVTCPEMAEALAHARVPPVVIDVRVAAEYEICGIEGAVHAPLSMLRTPEGVERVKSVVGSEREADVFVLCRRGNDSQVAVRLLRETGVCPRARDVKGGLEAWARTVDPHFPTY